MILSFFPFFGHTDALTDKQCKMPHPLILHLEEIFLNHSSLYNLTYLLFEMCCTVQLCHKQFTGSLFIMLQLIDICVRGKKRGKFLHPPAKKRKDKSQAINLGFFQRMHEKTCLLTFLLQGLKFWLTEVTTPIASSGAGSSINWALLISGPGIQVVCAEEAKPFTPVCIYIIEYNPKFYS